MAAVANAHFLQPTGTPPHIAWRRAELVGDGEAESSSTVCLDRLAT
jgi:hypothetical protein